MPLALIDGISSRGKVRPSRSIDAKHIVEPVRMEGVKIKAEVISLPGRCDVSNAKSGGRIETRC